MIWGVLKLANCGVYIVSPVWLPFWISLFFLFFFEHTIVWSGRKSLMMAWQQVGYSASLSSPTWSTRPTTGCRAGLTPLWVHRNLLWQPSRDRNLCGSGMSHATTASPELFSRAPWRVGDVMVSRGNAWWTTSKSGHPCPCQNCSQGPPAEKTGRGSLLNCPSCFPDDPTDQGT